ncbi:hypothetical protein [Paenibacillus hexagrammi]|uniref:Uncharacterized protein n=1 Tax=Paenibacillus hexagrammi TaxID=2908839 RepID=A0ABY3SSH3_9BACL|nr:hypothetical protein [Paenibacillus sp. YPD9-1]UJF36070.1 hypothetical protein L0M14_13925 [Paenibacillus sp. YPD9-1]
MQRGQSKIGLSRGMAAIFECASGVCQSTVDLSYRMFSDQGLGAVAESGEM